MAGDGFRFAGPLALVLIAGCSNTQPVGPLRPDMDMTPLGCGYKWFQSGYSPTLQMPCAQDRGPIAQAQMDLAGAHAREIANARCPAACPPVELVDPGGSGDAFPEGVCNNDFVYFTTRLFFQCQIE